MATKKIIITAFLILLLFQIYIPARMIFEKEDLMANGKEFKFQVAPIDPNDPMRGRYILLNFNESRFLWDSEEKWVNNQTVYVALTEDSLGFAKIQSVLKEQPQENPYYFKTVVQINHRIKNNPNIVFPFNRYYMEESKAPKAERFYNDQSQKSKKPAYALVVINKGEAVLKDLFVDGKPIKELVNSK